MNVVQTDAKELLRRARRKKLVGVCAASSAEAIAWLRAEAGLSGSQLGDVLYQVGDQFYVVVGVNHDNKRDSR